MVLSWSLAQELEPGEGHFNFSKKIQIRFHQFSTIFRRQTTISEYNLNFLLL